MIAWLIPMLGIPVAFIADGSAGENTIRIKPIAEIQRAIQRYLTPPRGTELTSEERTKMWLAQFRKIAQTDYDQLIPQLLYYSMYGRDASGNRDVREAMALAIVADQLAIEKPRFARALLPYFKSDDPELQRALRGVGLDYASFRLLVEGKPLQPGEEAAQFVRDTYDSDPGDGVLVLARRHKHGFLQTSRVLPRAAAEVQKLATYEDWWVRLYVAKILRQHPAFRTPELVARLAADKNVLVREAMAFAARKPEMAPKPTVKPSPTKAAAPPPKS
jgi:hypothetical protein